MNKPKSKAIFDDHDFPISVIRQTIFTGNGTELEEARKRPLIAIANSQTDINPGHMHLGSLASRVKEGILEEGGIPFEFNVPGPCDSIAEGNEGMRFILPQRDLIADIIETHVRSMLYDGIVFICSCDKIIPGMIMAAARLQLPAIFLTGGPNAFPIRYRPAMNGSVNHEAYPDMEDKLACGTCATCGACEYMGTANTMQCLTEALGLALPRSANTPAFHQEKIVFARKSGRRIVSLVEEGLTIDKILTMKAIENALMVDLAIGGSTNVALHLSAIAQACGLKLPLAAFNDYNKKIPTLCPINPNGSYGVIDLYVAGGIPAVMKRLETDLHLDAMTVSGQTIGEITQSAKIHNERVIMPKDKPLLPEGGTVVLFGNLAPEGAVIKQSAVAKEMLQFTGTALVFESEAECLLALRGGILKDGNVVVIRNEGPKGGPGMPETVAITLALGLSPLRKVALITDGRFSGSSFGPCVGHVSPEAAVGGPIAALRNGDEITIDVPARKINVKLSDEEIESRLKDWQPVVRDIPLGYMRRYVKYVSSAAHGAVME
jgi:dihydroxy-acid dehydratase